MERIPEPELMEDPDQALAYAKANFEEVNQAFVDRFSATFADHQPTEILDLGCGPADILIRFAKRYPAARCFGVDGSLAMLKLGQEAATQAALDPTRFSLSQESLPFESDDTFDTVVSNSLLHHLHEPQVLWQTIEAVAKPGAAVLVVDLMRARSRAHAQAMVDEYAAEEAPVLREDFFNSLLAAFTLDEVRSQLAHSGLGHLDLTPISDRHFAVSGLVR